jgi:glycerol-3-phosphate O-acyltransferase
MTILFANFQYMEQLLCEGENLEFFLEGGRSRTGKALQPKGGLLSIVVDSLTNGILYLFT